MADGIMEPNLRDKDDKPAVAFFNRYQGASCFICANGPSMGSLDLSLLRSPGIMTMAFNNGVSTLLMNGVTPDFWTCMDQPCKFVKQMWLNPKIVKLLPDRLMNSPLWDNEKWEDMRLTPYDCPNTLKYKRNADFNADMFFLEPTINWGCSKEHGGCRSVLLASIKLMYILGFRHVYLLGVDLEMTLEKKYHFDEQRSPGSIKQNNNTYHKIITEYGPGIAASAKRIGMNIYNCNPTSKLTAFPYVPFEEAVQKATSLMGSVKTIQTKGMYVLYEDKVRMNREEAIAHLAGIVD